MEFSLDTFTRKPYVLYISTNLKLSISICKTPLLGLVILLWGGVKDFIYSVFLAFIYSRC